MSSLFDPQDLQHLDQRSHDIVNGFIKNLRSSLDDDVHIEHEIHIMVLHFVHDHFMNYQGSNEWFLTKSDIMDQIRSSQPGQLFTSDTFDICKLKWMIHLYPNGDSQQSLNKFQLFIHLLSLPSKWRTLMVRIAITCKQLNLYCVGSHAFGTNVPSFAAPTPSLPEDILSFDELCRENPHRLTFRIAIKILQITTARSSSKSNKDMYAFKMSMSPRVKYKNKLLHYQNKYTLYWKMSPAELSKSSLVWLPNKRIYSRIFGDLFVCYYIPHEKTLFLEVCGLPHDTIGGLNVKWTISIPEAQIKHSITSKLMQLGNLRGIAMRAFVGRGGLRGMGRNNRLTNSSHLLIPSLAFDEWKTYESLTFVVMVEILNEFDEHGNMIGTTAEDEWKQIFDADKCGKKSSKSSSLTVGNNGKEIHKRNGKGAENVRVWMKEVVGLEEYSEMLICNGFDNMKAVASIKHRDLQSIGVDLMGHRKQISLFADIHRNQMNLDLMRESRERDEKKDDEKKEEDVENEVVVWLRDELKLPKLCKIFRDEKILDMELVKCLDSDTLNDMVKSGLLKLRIGDKLRLWKAIQAMKEVDDGDKNDKKSSKYGMRKGRFGRDVYLALTLSDIMIGLAVCFILFIIKLVSDTLY